jgi:ribosomal protein S18 acetylase RimI-like enzyme
MFSEVEKLAQEKGCCKLTLEVLEGNEIAKNAYTKFGYSGYELEPEMGKAIFWQKKLK